MEIAGLQKTTLVDYPGKVACTIFLHGCNFRCGFCYNAGLVVGQPVETFSEDYILGFLKEKRGKLDAVCITGGEPLLTLDENFLRKIKGLGYLIKIDTNGSLPERLDHFIDEGLVDFVAMDLKGARENYSEVVGCNVDLKAIENSMRIVSGLDDYEFRTTILPEFHDRAAMISLGKWVESTCGKMPERYYLQGFKSSGNFIDKKYAKASDTSENYLNELAVVMKKFFKKVEVRG